VLYFCLDYEILRKSPASLFLADRRIDVSIRFANAPKKVLHSAGFCENSSDSTGPINDRKFAGLAE
jgi:hypothetical protein